MTFCMRLVVTGKGNLYVPAKMLRYVSEGEVVEDPGALHERVNLLTTSKPESALAAAMAKKAASNCRSIARVNAEMITDGYFIRQPIAHAPNTEDGI